MSSNLDEICTKDAPSKNAKHHPDAQIVSRQESTDRWPHYVCPNCGLDTQLPEWNTVSAKKIITES